MDKTNTPRDVFMYLLVFAALYASVVSFIALLFTYVNVLFPDRLTFGAFGNLEQIRWSSSVLIIVFPLYLLVSWLINRPNGPDREIKIRKWLTYFTLFLAAVTIVVDLVTLFYNFYSGELTARFVLKVLAVLVVATAVFGFYFWDLRQKEAKPRLKIFAWITAVVVAAALVGGFFLVGSPATQRERRFDEQRTRDLQTLQDRIINYWTQKEKLPVNQEDLKDSLSGFVPPADPQTGAAYEYQLTGKLTFKLCAVFKTESSSVNSSFPKALSTDYLLYVSNWEHGPGRVCFDRTIDQDLYGTKKLPLPLR